ncbi:MAG: ester cyclase [Eudoraea sp.]|nr:ester cyclase [Eudoraea sp.]
MVASCDNANRQVEENITMYSKVWDDVINKGDLDQINDSNFSEGITLISDPENVVGINDFKDYYSNFITGFSDREFTINSLFGQDDKLVKHWSFKGVHSGDFFGIPATGKTINIDGVTLVKMKEGKIAQEQDFMDNLAFMSQLGIDPFLNPDNKMLVQTLYDHFAKGDIPAVLAGLDDKVVWNEAEGNAYADGNPYIGPDAVLKGVFERVGADYETFVLADIELHDMTNDMVLATLRYKGKVKKTGAPLDVQVAHLWGLTNGKAVSFQQYADTKQLHETRGN